MTAGVTLTELRASDVPALGRLHRSAFAGYFLGELGEWFVVGFYPGYRGGVTAVPVVACDHGAVIGAVVGTTEPAGYFRRLLGRRWWGFTEASVRAVRADPRKTRRPLRCRSLPGRCTDRRDGRPAEFGPRRSTARGKGIGVQLVQECTREMQRRGLQTALLKTDAEGTDAVNRFYDERGWLLAERYPTPEGRAMNPYTISMESGC